MIHVTEIVASKDIMLIENHLIEIQSTLHIIHRIIHSDTQWNPRDFVEGNTVHVNCALSFSVWSGQHGSQWVKLCLLLPSA